MILFPSLALLFGLVLRGRFDPGRSAADAPWAHIVGVVCLLACGVFAVPAVDPADLAGEKP